ncbi:MAG: heparinase II/III family protein [Planctomycetes bacterium]|nr:heparinase II/III family protein [Planctomycetota bacterium]
MNRLSCHWTLAPLSAWIGLAVATAAFGADPTPGPTDWSDWEKYRDSVVHPATIIKLPDLERARENVRRYAWAGRYVERLRRSADGALEKLSREYVEEMIEPTTPGCTGPCPACRAKGLPWHPNGQWSWSASRPDRLVCSACKTVFPNEAFPESVAVECTWGRGQTFTFIGGETFKCFGYTQARPSLSGIIRARKASHMTGLLDTLATAYALTDEPRYARGTKTILLRFADVFPEYLVRAGYGYGEYAGMDPHVAAERINDLPEDELVYPPNKPNRKIYTGYWSASRIGSSGMDGGWVVRIAVAYDLTCTAKEEGASVYSDDEKRRIEHDLLLESTYLAACDPAINNKSVGNRAGAAVVGMCVGHPGLVRFGLDGFLRTVDGWFLPDGGTSESPAYAMMTMGGIRSFGLAFRDYSDPPGYVAADGTRHDGFDACRDTRYGDCWQGLIWTLQGDLRFPPSADSYRTTSISPSYAELIAVAYPSDEHVALLKELAGKDLSGGSPREAVFYREPGLEGRDVRPLSLPDVVFPFLAQGYLRTGPTGRQSLLMLNASDYGGHHHLDALNLYYWKDGHELLSDLGYLWDHPDKRHTYCTFAHNLVMIDGRDQERRSRGGSFHLFAHTPNVKVMEASSNAYGPESLYRRTCVLIDHGPAGSYVVDVFRASGGTRRDYTFHGPGGSFEVEGLSLAPLASDALPLENVRTAAGESPWSIRWELSDGYEFRAFCPGHPDEFVALGDGWGQRDHRNTDRGATLPYVVRRRVGEGRSDAFAAVFAGNPAGKQLVHSVRLTPVRGGDSSDAIAVEVETSEGADLVVSMLDPKRVTVPFGDADATTDGRLTAIVSKGGKPYRACLVEGSYLATGDAKVELPAATLQGNIDDVSSSPGSSHFVVEGKLPDAAKLPGRTFFTIDGNFRRAYPMIAVEEVAGRSHVVTKHDGRGFEARPAERWEIPVAVELKLVD